MSSYCGIDLGWAKGKGSCLCVIQDGDTVTFSRLRADQEDYYTRLDVQRNLLRQQFRNWSDNAIVAMEDPCTNLKGAAVMLLPLRYFLADAMADRHYNLVPVAPTQLKAFLAGKGNADKFTCVQAAARLGRRLGFWGDDHDAGEDPADAFGLALLAWCIDQPDLPQWTQYQRDAVDRVLHPKPKRRGARKGGG